MLPTAALRTSVGLPPASFAWVASIAGFRASITWLQTSSRKVGRWAAKTSATAWVTSSEISFSSINFEGNLADRHLFAGDYMVFASRVNATDLALVPACDLLSRKIGRASCREGVW